MSRSKLARRGLRHYKGIPICGGEPHPCKSASPGGDLVGSGISCLYEILRLARQMGRCPPCQGGCCRAREKPCRARAHGGHTCPPAASPAAPRHCCCSGGLWPQQAAPTLCSPRSVEPTAGPPPSHCSQPCPQEMVMTQPHSVFLDFFCSVTCVGTPSWKEEQREGPPGSTAPSLQVPTSTFTVLFQNSHSSGISRSFYKKCCIQFSPSCC